MCVYIYIYIYVYIYIYIERERDISKRIKEDTSILYDSEFRAYALVRQNFIQWRTYLLIYNEISS